MGWGIHNPQTMMEMTADAPSHFPCIHRDFLVAIFNEKRPPGGYIRGIQQRKSNVNRQPPRVRELLGGSDCER